MGECSVGQHLLRIGRGKRGSLIVEASIILPLFIVGVLSVVMIMRYIAIQDRIDQHLMNEARLAAAEAHFIPMQGAAAILHYRARALDNREFRLENASVSLVNEETALLEADYIVKNKLPIDWIGRRPIREKALFRAWVGSTQEQSPMSWDDMQQAGESRPVMVFPRAGEKYHSESCGFIVNMATQTTLTAAIKRRYDPCSTCGAADTAMHELVYCYFKTGEVYHVGRCPLVDKYVIKIEETDAQERGYTPCMRCQ